MGKQTKDREGERERGGGGANVSSFQTRMCVPHVHRLHDATLILTLLSYPASSVSVLLAYRPVCFRATRGISSATAATDPEKADAATRSGDARVKLMANALIGRVRLPIQRNNNATLRF